MATKANPKTKFKVTVWRDPVHNVATLFLVVDQDGHERRRCPSEIEAITAAKELADRECAATEERAPRGFTVRVA